MGCYSRWLIRVLGCYRRCYRQLLVTVGLAAQVDNAKIVSRDVSLFSSYDYIVVGGGTSGLVVADSLAENKKSKPPE